MVITMLRGVGFEIQDLGVNISVEEFVRQVAEKKPDILGMSAPLTTTMPQMQKVIQGLEAQGLRDKVKVMVGGARLMRNTPKISAVMAMHKVPVRLSTWRRI